MLVQAAVRSVLRADQGISVPKILVADDNTNIQKMVALAFRSAGLRLFRWAMAKPRCDAFPI